MKSLKDEFVVIVDLSYLFMNDSDRNFFFFFKCREKLKLFSIARIEFNCRLESWMKNCHGHEKSIWAAINFSKWIHFQRWWKIIHQKITRGWRREQFVTCCVPLGGLFRRNFFCCCVLVVLPTRLSWATAFKCPWQRFQAQQNINSIFNLFFYSSREKTVFPSESRSNGFLRWGSFRERRQGNHHARPRCQRVDKIRQRNRRWSCSTAAARNRRCRKIKRSSRKLFDWK